MGIRGVCILYLQDTKFLLFPLSVFFSICLCVRAKMLFYLLNIDKCVAPLSPTSSNVSLAPLCDSFDVVSLVTFKIVFNYFLTSSSVKSVGRRLCLCQRLCLVIGAKGACACACQQQQQRQQHIPPYTLYTN